MDYLIFAYKWNSRELRKIINAILKAWVANNVKKVNYVQNYDFNEKKIEKSEEKILLIHTENQNKLTDFLSKNFSQEIEKINIS